MCLCSYSSLYYLSPRSSDGEMRFVQHNYCGAPRGAAPPPPHELALPLLGFRAWRWTEYGGVSLHNAVEDEKTFGRGRPLQLGDVRRSLLRSRSGFRLQEWLGYLPAPRLFTRTPSRFLLPSGLRCAERHHRAM